VEQPFQPADQLRLCDADLGFGDRLVEGHHYLVELFEQLLGQHLTQLVERALVHCGKTPATTFV